MKLIYPGSTAFELAISEINQAKHHIEIQMFIWRDDQIGNRLLDALCHAASRQVEIHIKKDMFGSIFEKSEENKQSMFHKDKNVFTGIYAFMIDHMYRDNRKPKGYHQKTNKKVETLLSYPNVHIENRILKDHTKYYIFDHKTLLIGGVNIEDKENNQDIQGRIYRDYMVWIEDESVVNHFKERLNGLDYDPLRSIEFITNRHKKEAKLYLPQLISNSNEKIIMHMAYFGAKKATKAILDCLKRGIKVEIVTSLVSNLQNDYNRKLLRLFYQHGATIYLHKGLVHAKALLIDDTSIIGSTNLNNAAFDKLGECSIILKETSIKQSFLNAHEHLKSESTLVTSNQQLKYHRLTAFFEKLVS